MADATRLESPKEWTREQIAKALKEENYKLEAEVKAKWIEALKSGNYEQATGVLYDAHDTVDKPKMCCLGVLEYICGTPLEALNPLDNSEGRESDDDRIEKELPHDLIDPKSPSVFHQSNEIVNILTGVNDGCVSKYPKYSFNEIADLIDECL